MDNKSRVYLGFEIKPNFISPHGTQRPITSQKGWVIVGAPDRDFNGGSYASTLKSAKQEIDRWYASAERTDRTARAEVVNAVANALRRRGLHNAAKELVESANALRLAERQRDEQQRAAQDAALRVTRAAPELLAALRGLLALAEGFDPMREEDEEELPEILAARAAIAKAEGR